MNDQEMKLKIDKARVWMMQHQPFYSQLAMNLFHEFGEVKTVRTDGKSVYWNKEYLAGLNDKQVRYAVIRESLHCGHQHLWRLPQDADGNTAGYYAIEKIMRGITDIEAPEGTPHCPVEFENLAEEEIFAKIRGKEKKNENGDSPWGGFDSPAGDKQEEQKELSENWKQQVVQAHFAAQMSKGDTPQDMLMYLERMRHQPIDWRSETVEFVRTAISQRNDWTRSPRRHAWQPVLYPRRKHEIASVIFAIDTSGSIDQELLNNFVSLAESACAELKCRAIRIDCDTHIHREEIVEPGGMWSLDAIGGGGTSFVPIFERATELIESGENVAGIVYLTDMYGEFPEEFGDTPTLWLCTSNEVAPFGRTVKIES